MVRRNELRPTLVSLSPRGPRRPPRPAPPLPALLCVPRPLRRPRPSPPVLPWPSATFLAPAPCLTLHRLAPPPPTRPVSPLSPCAPTRHERPTCPAPPLTRCPHASATGPLAHPAGAPQSACSCAGSPSPVSDWLTASSAHRVPTSSMRPT